jgi:predicted DNA-binding protein YlxM (UPF0122 family)
MSLQIIYDEIKKMDTKLNSIEDNLAELTEVLQEVKRKK